MVTFGSSSTWSQAQFNSRSVKSSTCGCLKTEYVMETTKTIHASNSDAQSVRLSKGRLWTGRTMSALPALFLLVDAVGKLVKPAPVVEGTVQLGYPESVLLGLGIVLLTCTVLYVIRHTAVLGAILLTGYLGGAVATHVRVGSPLFSHILFPVYLAVLIWGGLYLRDERLRALIPVRH
jgi:DoxX-like family